MTDKIKNEIVEISKSFAKGLNIPLKKKYLDDLRPA